MTMVATDLLNTRESARRIRVEPTVAIGGSITKTNVQKALEQIATMGPVFVTSIVTTTPVTIAPTVTDVLFNVAAPVSATLPSAAAWHAANPSAVLLLKDVSGQAQTNNITINHAGSDTIDGLTQIFIVNNYGFYRLKVNGTNWIMV